MSRGESIALVLAVITCAAAVMVVPEVRCIAGLDSASKCPDASMPVTISAPVGASLRAAPREDSRVAPIRQRYRWIENSHQLQRFEPVPVAWPGTDSASIIVYADHSGIAKITARVYSGRQRNVLKFYYSGASLIFVHQVAQTLHPERNEYEQRFYFDRGQMFRWLAPDGLAVSESAPDFGVLSTQLGTTGASLLSTASRLPRGG